MKTKLTQREKDVLYWAVEGKSAWEIGVILSITERTVKFHLSNVYKKLNVSTRAQAVAQAIRNDLIDTSDSIRHAS
jgi:DNA-binding CsgD family transcriptional regulator